MALVNDRFNAIVHGIFGVAVIELAQSPAIRLAVPAKIKMILDVFSTFQTVPHGFLKSTTNPFSGATQQSFHDQ
jgi:hypothetical protein